MTVKTQTAETNIPTGSVDDIADSLIVGQSEEEEAVAPDGATEDEQESVEDNQDKDKSDDDSETESSEEDEATDTEADDKEDEAEQVIELAEDFIISVTVDGEERDVTLADLKKAYSGEGAIEKRLQQVTEQKKEIEALKTRAEAETQQGREKLIKAFRALESLVLQPRVQKPDPSLRETNPTEYLVRLEAYREEEAALAAKKQQLGTAFSKHEQEVQQRENEQRTLNAQMLREKLPGIADKEKFPEIQADIVSAAKHYGFSDQELSAAYDHRLFLMAYEAAQYRKMLSGTKSEEVQAGKKPKTRVIVPKAKANHPTVTRSEKRQKAAIARAKQTGDVDDVAASLLVSKPRR